jgi:hypothetical protein
MLLAMPPRISIVCTYIFMHALSIRRVNPTDFDGRPKRQEEPEVAQVERLRVTTKRGDSTCPSPRSMSSKDATPRLVSARYRTRFNVV